MAYLNIKTIEEEVTHYPHSKPVHNKVTKLGPNNVVFEATEPKVQIEIFKFLQHSGLSNDKIKKLEKLIDDYGQFKYEEGSFDASYEG